MHLRLLASGLVFSLALAGCKTVPVEGDYKFADHPGKALVVLSTPTIHNISSAAVQKRLIQVP